MLSVKSGLRLNLFLPTVNLVILVLPRLNTRLDELTEKTFLEPKLSLEKN